MNTTEHIYKCLTQSKHDSRRSTSVGIRLTKRCNLLCRHCVCSCDPRHAAAMDIDNLRRWLGMIATQSNVNQVCFTGGEPFLEYDLLLKGVCIASSLGLVSVVVTNGYWGRSRQNAERALHPLAVNGLGHLSLSYDKYHHEQVSTKCIHTAIEVAHRLNIDVCLNVLRDDYANEATMTEHLAVELQNTALMVSSINASSLIRCGRAINLEPVLSDFDMKRYGTCGAMGIIIQENGIVYACCGPQHPLDSALNVGDINTESFEEIYTRALTDPFPLLLQTEGLAELRRIGHIKGVTEAFTPVKASQRCRECIRLATNKKLLSYIDEIYSDLDKRILLAVKVLVGCGDEVPFTLLVEKKAAC